jgi:uncharacterized membrane protein
MVASFSSLAAARSVAALAAVAALAVAGHAAFSAPGREGLAVLLALGPAALACAWGARRAGAMAVAGVACAAAMLGWCWLRWALDAAWPWLLQYLAMQAGLGFLFGRTLLPGREPLVATFARLVHGTIPAPVARYGRGVTWAWTVFFLAMALTALLLGFSASRETW